MKPAMIRLKYEGLSFHTRQKPYRKRKRHIKPVSGTENPRHQNRLTSATRPSLLRALSHLPVARWYTKGNTYHAPQQVSTAFMDLKRLISLQSRIAANLMIR